MKILLLVILQIMLWFQPVNANDVEIVNAKLTKSDNQWRVDVTLKHEDSGWTHYADAWRIVSEAGVELGKRVLLHPHETEQPFTRSLWQLEIPMDVKIVFVEAHDKKHGWSKQRVRIDLSQSKGKRFEVLAPH